MTTTLIATATTRNGYAIGVIKLTARNGRPYWEVVRLDRHSRYVTISRHDHEAGARARANVEYRADLGK